MMYHFLPTFFGFLFAGIILFYYLIKKNSIGVAISSLFFLVSGLSFQKIYDDFNLVYGTLKSIIDFPGASILTTALGIFIGNRILSFFSNQKEQKEISILFINSIKSQLSSLEEANLWLFLNKREEYEGILKIYISRIKDNKSYDTAFDKIGIYNSDEINLISKYSIEVREFLSYVERLFIENNKDNESIPTKNLVTTAKISVTTAIALGYSCVYTLSQHYVKEESNKLEKEFITSFSDLINQLEEYFNLSDFYLVDRQISKKIASTLIYVREKHQLNDEKYNYHYNPKYICRILFEINTLPEAINPLNLPYKLTTINKKDVFAFGESEDDAKSKAISLLKYHLMNGDNSISEEQIESYINNLEIKVDIISPWGEV